MKIIDASFYERDTVIVAQELIGKVLVREYKVAFQRLRIHYGDL
jgi:3-methyladenine DNA glycosylase Mpg